MVSSGLYKSYTTCRFFHKLFQIQYYTFRNFIIWVLRYSLTYCFLSHKFSYDKHQGWTQCHIAKVSTNFMTYIQTTLYIIYMKIYIYVSIIYIIYIYKVSTLWHRIFFFFFLQINVYSVSASKYKQIFPLRQLWRKRIHHVSYRYRDSTKYAFQRRLKGVCLIILELTSTICRCTSRRYQTTDECNNLIDIKSPNLP